MLSCAGVVPVLCGFVGCRDIVDSGVMGSGGVRPGVVTVLRCGGGRGLNLRAAVFLPLVCRVVSVTGGLEDVAFGIS